MFALFLTLCIVGLLVMLVGSIMLLVAAFRESVWWGLGCLLLGPVSLVFTVMKWQEAKKGFLTNIAGAGIVLVALLVGRQSLGERLNSGFAPLAFARKASGFDHAPAAPAANEAALAELGKREAELRARKASTSPQDIPALTKLRDDILQYNEDLKKANSVAVAPSKIASAIGGDLVARPDGIQQPFDAANLAPVRYYAVYFSAEWCPPCRAFTPQLVTWYKQTKAANPNFELIFVSRDHSAADMKDYMNLDAMPWPAVAFEKAGSSLLARYCGPGIPCLVFLDSDGKVLSNSFVHGSYRGPQAVLAEIGQTLEKSRAALAGTH